MDKKVPLYPPFTVIQGGLAEDEENIEDETILTPNLPQSDLIYIALRNNQIIGAFTEEELAIQYAERDNTIKLLAVPENCALPI